MVALSANSGAKKVVKITKLEPKKMEEEKFEKDDIVPVVEFDKKNEMEGGMIIMHVMVNAIALLTK